MKKPFLLFLGLCLAVMLQAQVSKTVSVTAGGLFSKLTATEKTKITNLTITGSIDARDFKTMRDDMPILSVLDLSGTTVAAFSGSEGTDFKFNTFSYVANEIPVNALIYCENLTSVAFPQTVVSIGKCAFEYCYRLKTVLLPNVLQTIGKRAFENCSSLTLNAIPATVISIGASAFEDCRSLVTLTLPNSIEIIDDGTFENCNNLTSIAIPSSVTKIGESAFEDCRKLKNITIPSKVTSIGRYAFENCRDLTSIAIPSSVTKIGNCAFKDCRKLNSITLPSSLLNISERIFEDCYALTSITFPSSVKYIEKKVLAGCSGLTSLNISPSVTDIDEEAFVECNPVITVDASNQYYSSSDGILFDKLKRKLISCPVSQSGAYVTPSTVDTIGKAAFISCTKITSFVINGYVKSISSTSFENCSGLITVSDHCSGHSSLEGLLFDKAKDTLIYCPDSKTGDYTIPSSVKVIGENAFKNCTKLNTITIPSSVVTIEDNAFAGSSGEIIVGTGNPNFASVNGVLFDKTLTSLIHFPINKTGSFTIPPTVSRIVGSAFEDCEKLESVSIPESVVYIGKKAFEDCYNLESINIPSMVDTLEARAFEDCKNLTKLTLPASITYMGSNLFQGCNGILTIYALGTNPVDLSYSFDVFYSIDKDSCLLYVEKNTKRAYQSAAQWKNFKIIEKDFNDVTAPTSKVSLLPETTYSDSVLVQWNGNDPEGAAITYTIYVSENGSQFSKWLTTTNTQAWFTGELNNTYEFYSIAKDSNGNTEATKNKAEAGTKLLKKDASDINPPISNIFALPEIVNTDSVLVKWQGVDPEGGLITYTIYVSENGSGFKTWLTTANTQAWFNGEFNSIYEFYSIAVDWVGNIEASKSSAEASTKMVKPNTGEQQQPIAIISQKWDDVLVCHNKENLFTTYQWFKNGMMISGENKQFYQETGGLNGIYYVKVTTNDGTSGLSNLMEITGSSKSMKVYPNPTAINMEFNLLLNAKESELEQAKLIVSTVTGQVFIQKSGLQHEMKLNGLVQGVYLVQVRFTSGETFNEKLIVK